MAFRTSLSDAIHSMVFRVRTNDIIGRIPGTTMPGRGSHTTVSASLCSFGHTPGRPGSPPLRSPCRLGGTGARSSGSVASARRAPRTPALPPPRAPVIAGHETELSCRYGNLAGTTAIYYLLSESMVKKSEKRTDDQDECGNGRGALPARIKARLYLLIAMALVPMLLLFVLIYYQRYDNQRDQALRTELEVAQGVATAFSAYINGVRLQLEVIGSSSPGATPAITTSLLGVAARYPSIRNLHWTGADGVVVASTIPEALGRDLSAELSFREVATDDPWRLGSLTPTGLFTNAPTVLLAVRARDTDGADHGHILASIEPERLSEMTLAQRRPEGGSHAIFDRGGIVAHRDLVGALSWEQRTGWREVDQVLSRVLVTGEPQVGIADLGYGLAYVEGEWLMARVPVLGLGWIVGAARPLETVLAPLRRDLIQDAAIAAAALVLALILAYFIARTIAEPLIILEADARAMGSGVIELRRDAVAPSEVRRLRTTVTRIAADLISQAASLRQSEQRYRSLFTNMTEGFAVGEPIFNGDGKPVDFRFLEQNQAFEAQSGLSGEVIGRPMTDVLPGLEPIWIERYCRVALSGEPTRFREYNRNTGRHFEVFCYRPEHLKFAIQFRNVTQEVRAEEDLREAHQALEALNAGLEERVRERTAALESANLEMEAFSYSVSHDLRAPLRSIDGFSKLLLEKHLDRLDPQGQNYLSRVRAAAQRMGRLIDDLLRLSRIGRAQMQEEAVNLSALAEDVVRDIRSREPRRRVLVEIEPNLVATGDAALLRIMLENLLDNSWKFTGKQKHPRIQVGAEAVDGERVFHVRDNGAGFSMDYADKLFAPFSRLHSEREFAGTGIGLAIAHRIVVRHAGRIWAEGAEDVGTTIHFTLGGTV